MDFWKKNEATSAKTSKKPLSLLSPRSCEMKFETYRRQCREHFIQAQRLFSFCCFNDFFPVGNLELVLHFSGVFMFSGSAAAAAAAVYVWQRCSNQPIRALCALGGGVCAHLSVILLHDEKPIRRG